MTSVKVSFEQLTFGPRSPSNFHLICVRHSSWIWRMVWKKEKKYWFRKGNFIKNQGFYSLINVQSCGLWIQCYQAINWYDLRFWSMDSLWHQNWLVKDQYKGCIKISWGSIFRQFKEVFLDWSARCGQYELQHWNEIQARCGIWLRSKYWFKILFWVIRQASWLVQVLDSFAFL